MCFGCHFKASVLKCHDIWKSSYRVGMMVMKAPLFCHEEKIRLSVVILTAHKSSLLCPGCAKQPSTAVEAI